MSQLLIKRVAVAGPSVLPELFAMVGNDDDESVFQNPELLQLVDQLLEAPVVVKNLAVVTIDGALDELVGIDAGLSATGAADTEAAGDSWPSPQSFEIAIEIRSFGGICELLFKSGGGPVRRVRIGCVRVKEEWLIAMLCPATETRPCSRPRNPCRGHASRSGTVDHGLPLRQVIEPALQSRNPARRAGWRRR